MSGTRSIAVRAQAGPAVPGRPLGLPLWAIATAQLRVVLDSTIVNVALPPIQRALGFSGSGLEWVVNAYALAFGGLLLRLLAAGHTNTQIACRLGISEGTVRTHLENIYARLQV